MVQPMPELTIDQALELAIRHRDTGRQADAEALIGQMVAQIADPGAGYHWLGLRACELGRNDVAIDLIGRAVRLAPAVVAYQSNLGEAYRRAGQPERSIDCLRRAIALEPGLPEAHYNLGIVLRNVGRLGEAIVALGQASVLAPDRAEIHNTLAIALNEAGRTDEALAASGRALSVWPDSAEVHSVRGNVLVRLNRIEEAIATFRRAIALKPELAVVHGNLGNALQQLGRLDEAVAAQRRALELDPAFFEAWSNLGNALREQDRLEEAIAAYRRAIELRPAFAGAHDNLGIALRCQGRHDDAVTAHQRAITLAPEFAVGYSNLGIALRQSGRIDEAIAAFHRAIALRPDFAGAYSNLGNALNGQSRHDEAIAALGRALEFDPKLAEAHHNLGFALLVQGRHEEAGAAYRRALELRPGYARAHSDLLSCMQYQTGVTPAALARAHAEWDEQHAQPLRRHWKPFELDRDPDRPLRLGFVSGDLRRHPVGFFLTGVLENLDRREFDVVCYETRGGERDAYSTRIAAVARHWHEVVGLDDDSLAARIRGDRIDILFDLAGHTPDNRLLVFARRPAPVQMTWSGYVGTTGVAAMDYLIADRFHVPLAIGAEADYRETILRMPDGYVCYEPPPAAPEVGPLPALGCGHVTFGCFNNAAKITSEVVATWAEILDRVPGSRLQLVAPAFGGGTACARLQGALAAAGGDPARMELRGPLPWQQLVAAYQSIDLALDTFPYSGGVTTCEALWMGVPVVTFPGATFASRHSFSHLSNVGLTESIASDRADYVERAVQLADALDHLQELRAALRPQMARSPLCDAPRFARHLATLLRDAWRRSCLTQ
jgi:predicted O-linked N-acetylglucosamine transferase (SPINDLY family)